MYVCGRERVCVVVYEEGIFYVCKTSGLSPVQEWIWEHWNTGWIMWFICLLNFLIWDKKTKKQKQNK